MPGSITQIFPRPRPVAIAGRAVLVHEARLGDLADLQAWLDREHGSAADGLAERIAGLPQVEADALLFDAMERASDGPPSWDSAEGQARLNGTPGGVLAFLGVALRRSMTPEEFADLIESRPDFDEIDAVRRVFYGVTDARRIACLLGVPPASRSDADRRTTLTKAVVKFAEGTGWTLDAIAELTISQFGTVIRGGETDDGSVSADMDYLKQIDARQKAAIAWREKEAAGG